MSRTATKIVAASNSTEESKDGADYVCDGTDDEVEIQAAIDVVSASVGGVVQLSEGLFTVGASVIVKANVYLKGYGRATIIKMANGGTFPPIKPKSNSEFSDLLIDGNAANAGVGLAIGLLIWDESNVKAHHFWVKDTRYDCINIRGSDIELSSFELWNSSEGAGLEIRGAEETTHRRIRISNFSIHTACPQGGIYGVCHGRGWPLNELGIQDIVIENGNIYDTAGIGISFAYSLGTPVAEQRFSEVIINNITIRNCAHGIVHNWLEKALITNIAMADISSPGYAFYSSLESRELVIKDNKYSNIAQPIKDTTYTHDIIYDYDIQSITLDLSGGETDIVTFPAVAGEHYLCGYTVLYTEASSADAGVTIRVGRLQADGNLINDYYDSVTSEVSKPAGYSKRYNTEDLAQKAIATGESVTVGTAGGKICDGEVKIILHIARL